MNYQEEQCYLKGWYYGLMTATLFWLAVIVGVCFARDAFGVQMTAKVEKSDYYQCVERCELMINNYPVNKF